MAGTECSSFFNSRGVNMLAVRIRKSEGQSGHKMIGRLASMVVASVLISSLMSGCACLAANSYSKPACQKYDTSYDLDSIFQEE
jgi:hypothetical protein